MVVCMGVQELLRTKVRCKYNRIKKNLLHQMVGQSQRFTVLFCQHAFLCVDLESLQSFHSTTLIICSKDFQVKLRRVTLRLPDNSHQATIIRHPPPPPPTSPHVPTICPLGCIIQCLPTMQQLRLYTPLKQC